MDSAGSGGEGRPPTDEEFAQLLAANQDVLLWFLKSLLPGSPDVDDILQETNLTLWKKRESFEIGTSFLNWGKAVARWEVRSWLTRKQRHSWLVFDDELTDAIASAIEMQSDGVGTSARQDALHECLEKLRPRDRLLVSFYYQLGKSLAECAEAFHLSAKSMKSTIFRIRAVLRRCIEARIVMREAAK